MLMRLDRALTLAEDTFISVLLIAASTILFVNVVLRYVFNTGFIWAEEMVRYQIVWLVFVGASVAARKGIHIGVDAIVHLLPAPAQKVVRVAVYLLCILLCGILVFYGAELMLQTREFNQRTPAMQAPFWLAQLAIPVGAALMALRFAQETVRVIIGKERQAEATILN
jgi:C4-dicarboxylate transporter DctQ subunit